MEGWRQKLGEVEIHVIIWTNEEVRRKRDVEANPA